jgi:hypothetical protein
MIPDAVGITTIVTVAEAPTSRVPRLAITVPPDCVAVPRLVAAETKPVSYTI